VARVSERLQAARRGFFVGREAERAQFQKAISSQEPPFFVLYMHGLGGLGKTALMREFASLCGEAGVHTAFVDGRDIDPSPESFLNALAAASGMETGDSIVRFLSERAERYVLFVDTYELLSPLDQWLRASFLPQLPDKGLVVLAGRQPPSPGWHIDSGWQSLLKTLPLRNLSPEESRGYLQGRNVPDDQHEAVLNFTHGHPLALSLVADLFAQDRFDSQSSRVFTPQSALDAVQVLVEHLVQEVSSDRHRAALEACALVRLTTESLLQEMLPPSSPEQPSAHELFAWLRSLSLIEVGPQGVFPHDLAREAIIADLRWRDPQWYAELHRRARSLYAARLQQTSGRQQQEVLLDYIYLHRANAVVRPFLEWRENSSLNAVPAAPGDVAELVSMVQKHEGPESAQIAAHWFDRQLAGVLVIRDTSGQIAGFVATVALHEASPEDLKPDPAATAAAAYLRGHAPLRNGEAALLFRFWMADASYQQVSPVQSLIFVKIVQQYFNTPSLSASFLPCADPEFWAPIFAYADAVALKEVDFEVAGRRYGTYNHNWRAVPPLEWLGQLAEREISASFEQTSPPARGESMVVLSEPEFEAALHAALRHLLRPSELSHNPLLRSRLVATRAGASPLRTKIDVLQETIRLACEQLQRTPRTQKFYLPLYHSYLHPAANQEHAAELLDISLSTFRRHLKEGTARVIESLWEQELRAS
jgi:hypothetical protein